MSAVTEQELKSKAVAPRITLEDLQNFIRSAEFLYTSTLTVCVLTLKNGFTVTGESACADPANYNKDIGDRLARENAEKKIWGFLGFELRSRLQLIEDAGPATGEILSFGSAVRTYVGTKVVRGVPMTRAAYNELRGWTLPANENGADAGFLVEYVDGGACNVEGYTGYISWSPKEVFEKAYGTGIAAPGRVTTFLDRLKDELLEVSTRRSKLGAFQKTAAFDALPEIEKQDLLAQYRAMSDYDWYLSKRYKRLSQTA